MQGSSIIIRLILELTLCVVASVLAVWLSSEAVGFRFFPGIVSGVSAAAYVSILLPARLRESRSSPAAPH